ncbi:hypothetical protein MPRF_20870 [Mycolicibacterium parafortuitum]|uniref:Uncharacterized protein n=1 Tax=Mycolicibacterium parafortuitum TaxID=39692 RepID=A0A7I7U1I9_MYCPF|nr:hypothetical protein MPRF_20870 [Mycolicibacterium parafortuitum]
MAVVGRDPVDEHLDGVVVADVARAELVRRTLDGASGTRHHRCALLGEDLADAGSDAAHASRHKGNASGEAECNGALAGNGPVDGVSHCASVPSKCLLR